MKKVVAIILVGFVAVLSSGCATFVVRRHDDRSAFTPLYPAVVFDHGVIEMGTEEGSMSGLPWIIFLFGVCDGPFSILSDTLCLPLDIGCWCCGGKKNSKDGPCRPNQEPGGN